MTTPKDTGAADAAAVPAVEAAATALDPQISLSLPDPAPIAPPVMTAAAPGEAPKAAEKLAAMPADKPAEMPKMIEMPKPVEAAIKMAQSIKAEDTPKVPEFRRFAEAPKLAAAPLEEPVADAQLAASKMIPEESRSNRFAMLAASVAFAGALGAMAGALGTSVFARQQPAEVAAGAVDLTPVRDAIASLRGELTAIKSSVENSNRAASVQLAKFSERLERIDRAQAAPTAQLKQAMEAIDRLEKRVQGQGGDVTGSVRPQQVAAAPPAAGEPPRQRVIDGWTVRHVSRGVAVIQGRAGAIEVEAGDVVPGVGRIESIRRQDNRWVVLTSNGLIKSPTPR